MNLANNHAYDFGPSGQAQTLAALAKQRLAHTGRPGQIAYQQVGEIKVAVVGFAAVPLGATAHGYPGGAPAREEGRSERRRRDRHDARRR